MTWTVFSHSERDVWEQLLPSCRNVFSGHAYTGILGTHFGLDCQLFYFRQGYEEISYAFYRKAIDPSLDVHSDIGCDIASVTFGGPLRNGSRDVASATTFQAAFREFCVQSNSVSEFIHVHPTDVDAELLPQGSIELNREIVYVDLSWPEDRLWNESFGSNCAKNIKRATKGDLVIREATSESDVTEFHRIYCLTMDRVQALHKYYFPLAYFLDLWRLMPQNCRFTLARFGSQVVGGLLLLHDNHNVYSFLCGFDSAYKHLCVTSGLHFEAMRWGSAAGKQRYLLGGGYRADDGVFQFKAGFSPLRLPFHVCKAIHQPDRYYAICKRWEMLHPNATIDQNFFPLYRSTPQGIAPSEEDQYRSQAAV